MTLFNRQLTSETKRRIQTAAEYTVSKKNPYKPKTPQSQPHICRETILLLRAELLACALRQEAALFSCLKNRKSKMACFRRRMIYWRMIHSYGLAVEMASWILGVEKSETRKNIAKAYVTLTTELQRRQT